MPRLFVAVWPPEEVLNRLAVLPRPEVDGLRWTDQDHWHVTLRFLGWVDEVEPVRAALAGVASSNAAVVAVLGPTVDRFGQRILHLPVAGLDGTAAAVVQSTAHLGKRPDDRLFNGHVTLARAARDAKVDLRPLTGTAISAEWEVGSVCLVESRLSPSGATYEVRERFELARRSE
jgi:2'-5' RNA ligase